MTAEKAKVDLDGLNDVDLEGGSGDTDGSGTGHEEIETAPGSPAVLSPPPLGFSTAEDGERRRAKTTGEEEEKDVELGPPPGATRERPRDGGVAGDAMNGLGEDEKPYNYICNLDKVNLGGPGWFNDVFKITVDVDSDRTWMDTLSLSLVPRSVFQRHCKLLDTSQPITGRVTVEAPEAKSVWLAGVTVSFEEHLLTVDSDGGELVGALEIQVAMGQIISGKRTFEFTLDLDRLDGHRHWPVRETYVGDLMALRHRVLVSAQRPWYTFNVYSQIPLSMECLSRAPEGDVGQDNEEGGPNHVLIISDCGGRCEFDFNHDSFNLSETLSGTVRFTGISQPIVSGHVMLLKAEFMYGEASEVLVAEHTVLGPKRRKPTAGAAAGLSEEEQLRKQFMSPFVEQKDVHFVQSQEEDCRMQEVLGDCELDVTIPLNTLWLTPSHMSLTKDIAVVNDEAELVGVRYYIRLILEDDNQESYWHTHEIFFHRSEPMVSSSSVGFGDDDSNSGDEITDDTNNATDRYTSPRREEGLKTAAMAETDAVEGAAQLAQEEGRGNSSSRNSPGKSGGGAKREVSANGNGEGVDVGAEMR